MSTATNNGLNPNPTQHQLNLFRIHKKNGTSPGNPKWYRNPLLYVRPHVFRGGPPKFPKLPTGSEYRLEMLKREGNTGFDPFHRATEAAHVGGMKGYIEAFDRVLGFLPVPYQWDKLR
jgi:hypothetical protein